MPSGGAQFKFDVIFSSLSPFSMHISMRVYDIHCETFLKHLKLLQFSFLTFLLIVPEDREAGGSCF